jgi:hypothetical protein
MKEDVIKSHPKTTIEIAEELTKAHPDFKTEDFSEYQNGRFNGIIEGIEYKKSQSAIDNLSLIQFLVSQKDFGGWSSFSKESAKYYLDLFNNRKTN